MFVNVFLILCAYYFVKPLREGWIAISDIGGLSKMEVKAYSSFAQSLFLLVIVGWYGRLATKDARCSWCAANRSGATRVSQWDRPMRRKETKATCNMRNIHPASRIEAPASRWSS